MKKKVKRKTKLIAFVLGIIILGLAVLFVLSLKSQHKKLPSTDIGVQKIETDKNGFEGLPDNFPVYKNCELITFAESEDGAGKSFIWETEDEAGLVYEYLKSELRIKDWIVSDESSMGGSYAISFKKDNMEGFLGVFIGAGGMSTISVSIREICELG